MTCIISYEQPLVVPQSSQTVQEPFLFTRIELHVEHCSPVYPLALASNTFCVPLPALTLTFAIALAIAGSVASITFFETEAERTGFPAGDFVFASSSTA